MRRLTLAAFIVSLFMVSAAMAGQAAVDVKIYNQSKVSVSAAATSPDGGTLTQQVEPGAFALLTMSNYPSGVAPQEFDNTVSIKGRGEGEAAFVMRVTAALQPDGSAVVSDCALEQTKSSDLPVRITVQPHRISGVSQFEAELVVGD